MKRRRAFLAVAAVGIVLLAALFAQNKKDGQLLVLQWAAKSSLERPPLAVLIEFGQKDTAPVDWSGKVTASGAKIVHREGYRFRPGAGDKLTDNGWTAKSHRGLRVPARQPAIARMEGIATIGVVLHLADIQNDASLSIETTGAEKAIAKIALADVLAGKPQAVFDGKGAVRLTSTALPIATGNTEDDFPAACYGPDGTLWIAWIGYHVKDESRRIQQQPLKEQPKDFKAYYTPEFGDQLFVKYFRDGKWSKPIEVTGPKEDIVGCAIACQGNGTAMVCYGARRGGKLAVQFRPITGAIRIGAEEPVHSNLDAHSYFWPAMMTDSAGDVWVAHMNTNDRGPFFSTVWLRKRTKDGWQTIDLQGGGGGTSHWYPSLSAALNNRVTLSFDAGNSQGANLEQAGDYDAHIYMYPDPNENLDNNRFLAAATARFEARPSITYDPAGRLWIAYEEGPEQWGKDYGALAANKGQPLYSSRSVRVVCLDNGKLLKPVAELPTSKVPVPKIPYGGGIANSFEKLPRYSHPKIGIDGKGRVWVTYRQKFGTRYSSHPGSYWLTFARRLDGDHWTVPIELHHSDGLLDSRPVLLPHKSGGLLVIHNTDGRYTTPNRIDNDIYISYLDLPGDPVEPKLEPFTPAAKDPKLVEQNKQEMADVKRIRDYRIEAAGKTYQLLRGDFHRHTEMSFDGGPDGSLEDMFRYAIDAANFDWVANTDHDNGGGREYSWWLTQKFTDAYTIPGRFTPLFGYERSNGYPHGHRNCIFAKRGVRTLPRLAEPVQEKRVAGIHADDTKMLYRYLKEMGGICASHTSATSMGTDWRDNDPQLEPLVEIYQGDRMSYEMEEAPRAGYDPKSGKQPANIAGWYPKGFIDHALGEKGYRLGFESSSDHWSTHISYTVVLAEKHDRESILDGMRKRHVYAATDNIICDVRSGGHLMGDEFKSTAAPQINVRVLGTGDLAKVEILRDSKIAGSLKTNGRECNEEWTDPQPAEGTHYYYIRVQQKNGEIAWTSPMWIEFRK